MEAVPADLIIALVVFVAAWVWMTRRAARARAKATALRRKLPRAKK